MCESKARGGKRCSTDAKAALDKKSTAFTEAMVAHLGGDETVTDEKIQRLRNDTAVAQFWYDTTPEGQEVLRSELERQRQRKAGLDRRSPEWEDEFRVEGEIQTRLYQATKVREAQQAASERYRQVQRGDVGPNTAKALADEQSKPPQVVGLGGYGPTRSAVQVGVLAVDEPFEQTEHYETAAWHTEHEVQPGIYPVYYNNSSGGSLWVSPASHVKTSHTPALFGGVPIGGAAPSGEEQAGKKSSVYSSTDIYAMPGAYTPGTKIWGGSLVLRDGVELSTEPTLLRSRDSAYAPTRIHIPEPKRDNPASAA